MSDPKEVQILKEITERCATINRRDGFYTDIGNNVKRGPINLSACDFPIMSVLSGTPAGAERVADRQRNSFSVTIEAHREIENHDAPEDEGWEMANDIYRAVEKRLDMSKPNALVVKRIEFVSCAVGYPEGEGAIVSAIVEYSINYSRGYGNNQT